MQRKIQFNKNPLVSKKNKALKCERLAFAVLPYLACCVIKIVWCVNYHTYDAILQMTSELSLSLYIYISGVRSSGHRVKTNMATNGALSPPARSFMFACYVKTAQGDWNRRNSVAAMFCFTFYSHSTPVWSVAVILLEITSNYVKKKHNFKCHNIPHD